jgi:hypothetical protein
MERNAKLRTEKKIISKKRFGDFNDWLEICRQLNKNLKTTFLTRYFLPITNWIS